MSSKHLIFYRLPVIALCGLIFWQSSYALSFVKPLFPHDDKVFHFIIYAVLAILTVRDLRQEKPFRSLKKIALTAILFSMIYGLSDEIHQAFVPSRCASFFDFLADSCGSIAGGLIMTKVYDQ
ncbi:MAG: VanZ family protein [Pseudomonadota bacterium]